MNWISVQERMPDDGERVLVYIPNAFNNHKVTVRQYHVNYARTELDWWIGGYQNYRVEHGYVTHWAPLPEPPKGELGDG